MAMSNLVVERPGTDEHAPYFRKYIDLVLEGDLIGLLRSQLTGTLETLRSISEADSLHRYEPGKWSIREVAGHVSDTERIFAYRALRFARNDQTPLSGFDQDPYIAAARFDSRPWSAIVAEFEAVRLSTLYLFEGFDGETWKRRGVANGQEITVRALAYVIAGHELHHMGILRERYL
jgi:DinB superfamily